MPLLLADNTPPVIINAASRFDVMLVPKCSGLPIPVASHPDMLLFCGFHCIFTRGYHRAENSFSFFSDKLLASLPDYTLSETSDSASDSYPNDISFNCALINGILFGLADFISPAIKRAATGSGIPVVNVKQGYTKCSSLIFRAANGKDAVITADRSIYSACIEFGTDVLLIRQGGIVLPGYNTGFIGGASFYTNNCIYFLGRIDLLPDYDKIVLFAAAHGVTIETLCDYELFDAGCLYIEGFHS